MTLPLRFYVPRRVSPTCRHPRIDRTHRIERVQHVADCVCLDCGHRWREFQALDLGRKVRVA